MWTVVVVVGLFEFYFPLAVTFDSGGFLMSGSRQKSDVVPVS